ncbi:MAG TPA: hypothetical protein VIE47_04080 [Methylocystis sp.]
MSRFGGGVNRGREPKEGDSADADEEKRHRGFQILQAVKPRFAKRAAKK